MTALTDPETALRQIAESADVFQAGGGMWLLAPAPPELVNALDDLPDRPEDDDPLEDDGGREPDDPAEDGDPMEPDYRL